MTPAARLQAALDLLEDISQGGVADAAASRYFRDRRYIGAKDRTAISERFYGLMRRRARLEWWVNRLLARPAEAGPVVPRHLFIMDMLLTDAWIPEQFEKNFDGEGHRPHALSRAERSLVDQIVALRTETGAPVPLDHPDMPLWVRVEIPQWSEAPLSSLFNGDEAELAALNTNAALDLRINALHGTREAILARLTAEGLRVTPGEWSPLAVRVEGRPALGALPAFRDGVVEIQDEGSQLVALLADAKPGQWVIDYCAGAGGKTLALAADMANKGRLIASDISVQRLERAVTRLRRAGVHNVERRALGGENASWFKRQAGKFDRVLVDAPCSGTGTWRRNPDMKWRIGPDDVAELTQKQREILGNAAKLVKPGGRLIYATCSLLPDENEASVDAFLADHPDFEVVPVTAIWAEKVATPCPAPGPYLRLTPHRHGTDGFFTAVLARRAAATPPTPREE
ncbi:rRNA cytosine-C5-methylase [Elstera cyanobacteriorum]|uniref:SAM-dependent MTase RsmB/NOP-type domain-containing protein n=1 Tax=Elstera cyanobacteriorum TaxID=2022747 RepID=A0A255XNS0_9PROT|nr:RsmB/NOP family class I SAM-dependent RNA methyltransferase [Elstera cyanobacteriorum]OYQ18552.1 hypothetical protein CHR90_09745 [Elstera cyanobacteriorum]GFZ79453.1 rRNA cytosine-C5-methylase [Elstera cyanobacteriorum]